MAVSGDCPIPTKASAYDLFPIPSDKAFSSTANDLPPTPQQATKRFAGRQNSNPVTARKKKHILQLKFTTSPAHPISPFQQDNESSQTTTTVFRKSRITAMSIGASLSDLSFTPYFQRFH
jgi:hypothetical protein